MFDTQPNAVDPVTAEAVLRYAVRLAPYGPPKRCEPTKRELASHPLGRPEWKMNTGKIVFWGRWEADAFADFMYQHGKDRLESYECPRGGHWHTRNAERARRRETR